MRNSLFIKNEIRKALFALLLGFSFFGTKAQTYYFENYSVRQGLANSKVYDLVQDQQGYIWLATPSGLSRFDGEDFKSFGLKQGLSESSARALYVDKKGHLWIGFETGEVYARVENQFMLMISDSLNPKGSVSDITENNRGEVVVVTDGSGLFLIQNPLEANQNISHFSGKNGVDQVIFKAETFSNGQVYLATTVDMMYMDSDSAKFNYFRPKGFPSFFLTTCMLEDRNGCIWIGKYNGGLYKYDPKSGEYLFFDHRDGLAKNWVTTLYEDLKGQIWVGTWGEGVSLIYDDKVQENFNTKNGLNGLNIQKISGDKEGNIYISTQENGFHIFKGKQFLSMTEENGLPNSQVWDICEMNDSTIFVATNNGLAEVVFSSPFQAKVKRVYNESNSLLISNKVRTLKRDLDGNIWAGTYLSGIQKFDIKKKEFIYDHFLNSNLPPNAKNISEIEILDDELFIGTVDGLLNHEINSNKTFRISQTDGLSGNDISSLFLNREKKLWIGIRNKGVNFIEDNIITALPKTKNITPNCFTENSQGELWIGTFNGVYKLQGDSLQKIVDENNGLLSNYVSLLHFIDDSHLIIGSNNGLNIFNLETNQIVHYNKNLGYIGIETKNNSFLKKKDGVLLFGTTGGLMIYNPKSKERNVIEPFVQITNLKVNMEERKIVSNEKFHHSENSFLFNYHAISLSNQPDLVYQVMVEGIDMDWREPTQSQSISFSQLSPGKYTFKVKARTFDGVENAEPASYVFTVRPPFWMTWWFIGGSFLLISVSIISVVRYRIYLLKKEKKILEQKVADRTKEISQKNLLLADKNKHITDSINYARRIQYATMRPEAHLNDLYKDAFILYIPKDIVSGDFYWYIQKGKHLVVAAADCTGHGVPGAFMSMLGIAYLNEIVGRMSQYNAGDILEKLRANVIGALNQSDAEGSTKDGMDIALVVLNTENNQLQYAGAYNPLYIVRNQEIIEEKPDRMPIGVHARDKEAFTNHVLSLEKGDQLYIFTDGFADQFGGPNGKKMNYKRFKELILDNQNLASSDQRENLLQAFTSWKHGYEQLDDVLVIGLKV